MKPKVDITAVDLFCGVGGLTHGLAKAGIDVKLGVDIDAACQYPLEANNAAKFLKADVSKLTASDINAVFNKSSVTLLAGCAPCQPFSSYAQSVKREGKHEDWGLLTSFSRLVLETRPTLVTMENVPPLSRQQIFKEFVSELYNAGYSLDYKILDNRKIGLPQRRRRLVLVASLLGPISLTEGNSQEITVKDAIFSLPPLEAGMADANDPLHTCSSLSPLNLERIQHSIPGGTWRDWPKHLVSSCHTRKTGTTYPSVYGRMEWDKAAPTITTQCYGYGNGRFGHPEQNRAISLREAAILQSFPRDYAFVAKNSSINFRTLGRLIGNAVPVVLGKYIGEILLDHVKANV